jgi:hypothetical protein
MIHKIKGARRVARCEDLELWIAGSLLYIVAHQKIIHNGLRNKIKKLWLKLLTANVDKV